MDNVTPTISAMGVDNPAPAVRDGRVQPAALNLSAMISPVFHGITSIFITG
jgi:hypothetical protein